MKPWFILVVALASASVRAQDVPAVEPEPEVIEVIIPLKPEPAPLPAVPVAPEPTKTDGKLKLAWNYMTDGGNAFHFLDNGTAASLYDFNRREWLGGVMTALYQPIVHVRGHEARPFSFDVGIVKSLEAGNAAFPFGAVRFHGRDMLAKTSPTVQNFFNARSNLLKYLTCGGWAARDWNIGEYRYGGFIGAEAKLFK